VVEMDIKEIMIYCFNRIVTDDKLRESLVSNITEDKDVEDAFIKALDKIAEEIKIQKKRLEDARQIDKDVGTELGNEVNKD
jgi:hypothetical protein